MEVSHLILATAMAVALVSGARGADATTRPLPEGRSLLEGKTLADFMDPKAAAFNVSAGALAKMEVVKVADRPFDTALRIETLVRPAMPWGIQWALATTADINRDDVVVLSLWARCVESKHESTEGTLGVLIEQGGDPYAKVLAIDLGIGREWAHLQIPVKSAVAFKAGEARVMLRAGFDPQVIEVADLKAINLGKSAALESLEFNVGSYDGGAADAPWRAEAAARIDKLRKGDITLRVVGGDGKPVAGAEVHVRMTRHAFGFGSCVTGELLMATGPDADHYRDIVSHFSRVVMENDLKWDSWEDSGRRARTIKAIDWLLSKGIEVRGHNLIWPAWRWLPARIAKLKDDPKALDAAIKSHIVEEVSALAGKIVEWDVVNEPYANHDVMDVLGNQVVAEWYKLAGATDPKALLFANDYGILSGGGQDRAHRDFYFDHIRGLLDAGAPLRGIGMQGHFGMTRTSPAKLMEILDRFGELGLPIEVTEFDMDMPNERLAAEYLRDFYTVCFSHPKVEGILMWGFWEGAHWIPNAALWRRDWKIKPSGKMWMDLVTREWWTDQTVKTGADGTTTLRGFQGHYMATTADGAETKFALGKAGVEVFVKSAR